MALYRLTSGATIIRTSDGAIIPTDPANRDYGDYLAWVALGNVADQIVPVAINQVAQRNARREFRARKLEADGKLIEAYALRNNL